jgi:hypothetical protein
MLLVYNVFSLKQEQNLKDASPQLQRPPPSAAAASSNPFADSSPVSSVQTTNLFGSPSDPLGPSSSASRPSDDLLSLAGNPFMDNVQNVMSTAYPQTSNNPFGSPGFQSNGKMFNCIYFQQGT